MQLALAIESEYLQQEGDLDRLFRAYVADPRSFWKGATIRQAEKLERKRNSVNKHMGWSSPDVASSCLSWARKRKGRHPPIHITGLGGSGSHWLAGMLGDLPLFFDVGEVYVPERLRAAMNANPDGAPLILDALHVLHTRQPATNNARAVNCAAGSHRGANYVRWDPGATVVRLLRDPRDQVLSTTFRKDEYRQWVARDAQDFDYLHQRCAVSKSDQLWYQRSGCAADIVVKYEDLRRDPVAMLEQIVRCVGLEANGALLETAAVAHDAKRIRAGQASVTSNLDLAGPSLPWSEESMSKVAPIHAELIDVIERQAYPFGPCLLPPPKSDAMELGPDPPEGVRIRGWKEGSWSLNMSPSEAFLAEVSHISSTQVSFLQDIGVYGVCAARLDIIPDDWLESILRILSLRTLDLGSVSVSESQLGLLAGAGSSLRALNLWRSCPTDSINELRRSLPTTTVVG